MSARTREVLLAPRPKMPKREHPTFCCEREGGSNHRDCSATHCALCSCDECKDGREYGIRFPPGHDLRVKDAASKANRKQLELFAEAQR